MKLGQRKNVNDLTPISLKTKTRDFINYHRVKYYVLNSDEIYVKNKNMSILVRRTNKGEMTMLYPIYSEFEKEFD